MPEIHFEKVQDRVSLKAIPPHMPHIIVVGWSKVDQGIILLGDSLRFSAQPQCKVPIHMSRVVKDRDQRFVDCPTIAHPHPTWPKEIHGCSPPNQAPYVRPANAAGQHKDKVRLLSQR